MGVAYYIALDPRPEGAELLVDGKAVAHAAERLAKLAAELGVPPLESFFSAAPGELDDLGDDLDGDDFSRPPVGLIGEDGDDPEDEDEDAEDDDGDGEPEVELVERLGIAREEGWLYFLKDRAVYRTPLGRRPGSPSIDLPEGAAAEKVAEASFEKEPGWLYYLDERGDVVRVSRTPKPRAAGPGEPEEQWFEPAKGLLTLRALRAAFPAPGAGSGPATKDSPGERRAASWPDDGDVAEDLDQLIRVLEEAERRKLRFHLAIDF